MNAELGDCAPGDKMGCWAEALIFLFVLYNPGLKAGAIERQCKIECPSG